MTKTVVQKGELTEWWVHLKNRPGFRVLGHNMAEAKAHATMCIDYMNACNKKCNQVVYHGISKV